MEPGTPVAKKVAQIQTPKTPERKVKMGDELIQLSARSKGRRGTAGKVVKDNKTCYTIQYEDGTTGRVMKTSEIKFAEAPALQPEPAMISGASLLF